jgi:hypothetical protein
MDQATKARSRPPTRPTPRTCGTDSCACLCRSEPVHAVLTPCLMVHAASPSSRCGPNRTGRPRTATISHDLVIFCGSLSHFDKVSAIFEFLIDHFATLLQQCSAIFVFVLSHVRELSHFLVAIVLSCILAI